MKHSLVNKPQFALVGAVSVAALACALLTRPALAARPVKPPTEPTSTAAYKYINLGPAFASATSINDSGYVVGSRGVPSEDGNNVSMLYVVVPQDGDGDGQPDTWYIDRDGDNFNDLLVDIDVLPLGGNGAQINNQNQILLADSILSPTYGANGQPDFVNYNRTELNFGSLVSVYLQTFNSLGQVIGDGYLEGERVGFVYDTQSGRIEVLGHQLDRGGNWQPVLATAINDAGDLALNWGEGPVGCPGFIRPAVVNGQQVWFTDYNNDGMNDLAINLLAAASTCGHASAIGPHGKVAGTETGTTRDLMMWEATPTGIIGTKLPLLNKGSHWASGINSSDVVVGRALQTKFVGTRRTIVSEDAFVTIEGKTFNLSTITDQADALKNICLSARGINEAGVIVGCKGRSYPYDLFTTDPDAVWNGFVAVPVKK